MITTSSSTSGCFTQPMTVFGTTGRKLTSTLPQRSLPAYTGTATWVMVDLPSLSGTQWRSWSAVWM